MREAIQCLHRISKIHDLDSELFGKILANILEIVKEWGSFKKSTKNTCKVSIDMLETRIIKRFSVETPPKLLCLHLKRVYYNAMGIMSLNRQFVKFTDQLDLSQIVMFANFNDYRMK